MTVAIFSSLFAVNFGAQNALNGTAFLVKKVVWKQPQLFPDHK